MMKTIYLVTGAAGHLGSVLVRKLCAQGERVRALVLPGDPNAVYLPKQARLCPGDVTCPESIDSYFRHEEGERLVVIHAAGIVSISSHYDPKVHQVNVRGTANVVNLCRKYHADKLVYVSSVHSVPELPKGQTMTEVKQFDYHKVVGLYAKTKAAATALVLRAAEKGLDASVVHPSGIIGPFDPGHGHLTQLVIDYCKGSLTAGVKGGYDFVDVRDVADGVLSCCNVGKRGECYFLTNRCYTLKEVLDLCSSITGRRPIRTYLPMWFARGTAGFSEIYYKLRRQPPLYTSYSLYTVSGNAAFSHRKADRELGYHPRPLKDTLRDSIGWLEMLGRIPPQKGLDFQRAPVHG